MSSSPHLGAHLDPEKASFSDCGSSVTQFADIHPGHQATAKDTTTTTTTTTPHPSTPNPDQNADEIESDAQRDARINEELTVLARQISNHSHKKDDHGISDDRELKHTQTKSTLGGLAGANPFEDPSHPELNPNSNEFDPRKWVKLIMRQHARHSDNPDGSVDYDALRAGLSFQNLNVHGFGRPTDFQKNVGNIWLSVASSVKSIFGADSKTKIQILREFEGVVRAGEMLVVLGRPGSGCSTFLKTVAGETHGFFIGDGSELNYQGIGRGVMTGNFRGEVIYQAETDGKHISPPRLQGKYWVDFSCNAQFTSHS